MVSEKSWRLAIHELADGHATVLGLWADANAVNLAILDEAAGEIVVLTLEFFRTANSRRSVRCTQLPHVSNVRCTACTGWSRSDCRMRGPGSISAAGT